MDRSSAAPTASRFDHRPPLHRIRALDLDGCHTVTEDDRALAADTCPADGPIPGRGFTSMDLWVLHVAYARNRSALIQERLLEEYRPYLLKLTNGRTRDVESFEDLFQVACEAFIRALDRFEPERRLPFPALATPTILGALNRHYRDRGWAVHVPRSVHDLAPRITRATDRLTARLGRSPTAVELADDLGISVEHLLEVQEAVAARNVSSIDQDLGDGSRVERVGAADPQMARMEDRITLRQLLERLPDEDRRLLHTYFVEERSQADIAVELHVSQMQVSRRISSAVRRMRSWLPA